MARNYEERPQENKVILRPISLITKGYVHWAAAIMIRLENALMELKLGHEQKERDYKEKHGLEQPDICDMLKPSEVESRFRRLLSDVVLGYDSNIPERKHVDPDTYAAEVRRSEHARLSIQLHMDEVLEEIGKHWMTVHWESGFTEPPIFVIPVVNDWLSGDASDRLSQAYDFLHTQRIVLEWPKKDDEEDDG